MRIGSGLSGIAAAVFAVAAPAFPQAPAGDDAVIQALTAKAAAIKNCHYRVEWDMLGGLRNYTIEVWYAGPGRIKTMAWSGAAEGPATQALTIGDKTYSANPFECEVAKVATADRPRAFSVFGAGAATPSYVFPAEVATPLHLTAEYVESMSEVVVTGTEQVGDSLCYVIDCLTTASRLMAATRIEEDDFVAFIPKTRPASGVRLWVDAESALVRRASRLTQGRVRPRTEVVEAQRVDGFLFPSLVKGVWPRESSGRVTDVTVNQGTPEGIMEFRPRPDWLVRDANLTLDQVRERLQAEPDDPNLHYTLGKLQERVDPRAGERAFRRAAELAPESPTPLVALAGTLQRGRDRDEEAAIDVLRRAMALAGDDAWYLRMRLAGALRSADRIDEAIAECRQLQAAESPISTWVGWELAGLLAQKQDFEGAYRAAAEMPLTVVVFMEARTLVEWAEKSDHLDDLRARVEGALAQDPESNWPRLLLARVLLAQGDPQAAAEQLKAIRLGGDFAETTAPREVISLAEELGDPALASQVRLAVTREAIESGNSYLLHNLDGGGQSGQERLTELMRQAGALLAEGDAARRAAVLDTVQEASRWMVRRPGGGEDVFGPDPDELTPGECAVAAVIESGRAERAHEQEAAQDSRARAAAYFERALAEWPDDAVLWAGLGLLRWSAEDWAGVVEAYRKAAAADPRQIEYPARLAFALIRAGAAAHNWDHLLLAADDWDQLPCKAALEIGRQAIEPWPDEWAAQAFFASLQMDCGQFEPARKALVAVYASPEVEELHQRAPIAHLLVRCHERLGEIDQAEAVLKREVVESASYERMDAHRRLIAFYDRQGRAADGYAAARAYYADCDEDWMRDNAVDRARDLFGNDLDALAAAAKADLAAHPEDGNSLRFAAAVYRRIGRLEEALELLRPIVETANDADLWIELAEVAERADDGALLAEALRRAVELRPDDAELRIRHARAAAAQGDQSAARSLADELRAGAGESPDVWREVAEMYLIAESWDDALAAAERVLALTPEADESARMRAQVLVARVYAGKRDDHEARRRLIPILARSTDTTVLREAADALVDLYLLRGDRRQAIATIEDLRLRIDDRGFHRWLDQRLQDMTTEEEPPPEPPRAPDEVLFLE